MLVGINRLRIFNPATGEFLLSRAEQRADSEAMRANSEAKARLEVEAENKILLTELSALRAKQQ